MPAVCWHAASPKGYFFDLSAIVERLRIVDAVVSKLVLGGYRLSEDIVMPTIN